jgi:hypothetical protein
MSNNNQEDNQIEKEKEGEDKDEENEENKEENEENEPELEKNREREVINFNILLQTKEEYPLRVIIPKPNYQILEPQL